MERASARINKRAMLSANTGVADTIILDSGATGHYLKFREYFTSFSPIPSSVFAANGHSIPILGEGQAIIPASTSPIIIPRAYFVPDLSDSLIPLTHYIREGYSVRFVL